MCHWRSWYS